MCHPSNQVEPAEWLRASSPEELRSFSTDSPVGAGGARVRRVRLQSVFARLGCKSRGGADSYITPLASVARIGAVFVVSSLLAGCFRAEPPARDTPTTTYDPVSGRLKQLEFDTTHNGRNDSIGFMDGTVVQRIEVDEDEDGKVDRWEFYGVNRRLERVGYSRRHNGVLDAMAHYGEDDNVQRIEIATQGDGPFNRVEFYESGSLARVEEDTNGDGRVDKWETYAADAHAAPGEPRQIATASFDDAFRGTPTRRLVYRPDRGGILRVEVDPDGDGIFQKSTAEK